MKTREQRIEAFINSLETVESDGCQSFLLTTDMSAIGGDNGGNCRNSDTASCSGVANQGNCKNFQSSCGGANNALACENKPGLDPSLPSQPDNGNTACGG